MVPTNQINVALWKSDGTPFSGTLVISWPSFILTTGDVVAAGTQVIPVVAGVATVVLVVTDQATQPVAYTVATVGDGVSADAPTQQWTVPSSPNPLVLAQVIQPSLPPGQLIIPLNQLQQDSAGVGSVLVWNGTQWAPGVLKGAVSFNVSSSINNGSFLALPVTVTGAVVGDTVAVGVSPALPNGVFAVGAVTANGVVTITIFNLSGAPVTPGNGLYAATIVR